MNTGPASRRGDDWFGAAVNIAAHVCGLAGVVEVLLTAATARHAGLTLGSGRLSDHGPRSLRHVSRPVNVYALTCERPELIAASDRDPVCLMGVAQPGAELTSGGVRHVFCSPVCAEVFLMDPDAFRGRTASPSTR